jgi:hypothetical protein
MSCEATLVLALIDPANGRILPGLAQWVVTRQWPASAASFDVARPQPAWSDLLDL